MRSGFLNSWFLNLVVLFTATCARAQDLPSRNEILADLRLVQDHWMAPNPDPGNRGWARSAYFTGHVAAYAISPDEFHLADITTSISGMVESTPSDDWWWCDALFMAMPVFTGLGIHYDDDRYYDKLHDLYTHTRTTRGLYDSDRHLWYRDESYLQPFTTPSGAPCFWSRGNGWVFAGHAHTDGLAAG